MTPRFILSTIVEILGLLAVVLGVLMLSIPAGIITAGLVLVLIGYASDAPLPRPKGDR